MTEAEAAIPAEALDSFAARFLAAMGTGPAVAGEVAAHLVEADLMGVHSHGTVRLAQYADWWRAGHFDPAGTARIVGRDPVRVDAGNGFGIPAMRLAIDAAIETAQAEGSAATGLVNSGHTGRIGAFAERAAAAGCLGIVLGGGSRRTTPQVAPHGGARAVLPTNPYAIAVPGGAHGAVALDFATAAGAGGKVLAARYAGRLLAEGLVVDSEGRPSTDPADYEQGGALRPMAGPKGYGLGLIAELLGGAMLGEARHGMNWLCLVVDTTRFAAPEAYRAAAEVCLGELRSCPPAPGFARVEIPGER